MMVVTVVWNNGGAEMGRDAALRTRWPLVAVLASLCLVTTGFTRASPGQDSTASPPPPGEQTGDAENTTPFTLPDEPTPAIGQPEQPPLQEEPATDAGAAPSPVEEDLVDRLNPISSDRLGGTPTRCRAAASRCFGDCPTGQHAPSSFLVIDALFLQRDNGTNNQVIAEDNGGGRGQANPLFTTRDMRFTIGPGTRIFYGSQQPGRGGWEIGYLGVYGMYGDEDANATDLLAVPGPLGNAVPGWDRADTIRPNYSSNLNMVEVNAFSSESSLRGDRWAAAPWQRLRHRHDSEWLAGFRWAELDEIASLNVIVASTEPQTSYRVATTSQFFAPQVGWRGRGTWDRWLLEGWIKTALAGTLLQSNAAPITSSLAPGVAYRDPRKNSTTSVGFIGDIAITGGYRFNETWALRTGYTMIWLTGVALAGNQFDFTDTADSGTRLFGAGTVFLQGATLGLEGRW